MEHEQVILPAPCSEQKQEERTLSDTLDELCAFYMAIGVPYDVFWYGDYCCLKYYVNAYERQYEMNNEKAWLQGLYFERAMDVCLTWFGYSFNGCKGQRPTKQYPAYPLAITENEKQAERQRKMEESVKWFENGQK